MKNGPWDAATVMTRSTWRHKYNPFMGKYSFYVK